MRFITPELRAILSKPQGKLVSEPSALRLFRRTKAFSIVVGDVVAKLFLENKITPDLVVYDLKKMRKPVGRGTKKLIESFQARGFRARNPAGTITTSLFSVLKHVFSQARRGAGPAKLFVEGEEDLSVIPVVLLAPENSIVAYGQPRKGVVVMKATEGVKKRMKRIYAAFAPGPARGSKNPRPRNSKPKKSNAIQHARVFPE